MKVADRDSLVGQFIYVRLSAHRWVWNKVSVASYTDVQVYATALIAVYVLGTKKQPFQSTTKQLEQSEYRLLY
jgi:hypothetical protein